LSIEYRSRELEALQLIRLELIWWRKVSSVLISQFFGGISAAASDAGIRVTRTPVWKLPSYKAAKLTAPCFGFVDAIRRIPIPALGQ